MHQRIPKPSTKTLLVSLLSALPAAAVSPTPPESLLPFLSPILRQRVQLLSATAPSNSTEPWLPLLCYDTNPKKVKRLIEIAKFHEGLEAHPVSGEVELDWEDGIVVLYRRIDEETLQASAEVKDLGLWVRLVWCTGDAKGEDGPDGWRIGEVSVMPDAEDLVSGKNEVTGCESIGDAEGKWRGDAVRDAIRKSSDATNGFTHSTRNGNGTTHAENEQDEDDDDYWAQYDANTPPRTPAMKRSPAPNSMNGYANGSTDEDAYYAQYASVQPALDNDDPDEADQNGPVESTLNGASTQSLLTNQSESHPEFLESSQAWKDHDFLPKILGGPGDTIDGQFENMQHLEHPQPGSSPSSNGSIMIKELERKAAGQESSEMAVRQHIGSSLKSLFRLSRTVGMEIDEFERVVRTEIQMLSMMEDS